MMICVIFYAFGVDSFSEFCFSLSLSCATEAGTFTRWISLDHLWSEDILDESPKTKNGEETNLVNLRTIQPSHRTHPFLGYIGLQQDSRAIHHFLPLVCKIFCHFPQTLEREYWKDSTGGGGAYRKDLYLSWEKIP